MSGTESYYAEVIANRLVDKMPETIGKLRPNSIFNYNIDEDDLEIMEEHPNKFEYIVHRGVVMACGLFWKYYKVRHIEDELLKKQQIVKDNMSKSNEGLFAFNRIKVNLIFYPTVTMRQISPKIEKKLIVVDGRIMAVSDKKGYLKSASIFCENDCDTDSEINASDTLRTYIPKCSKCKVKMKIRHSSRVTDYVQTIMIQEIQSENLIQRPITFNVKVTGDYVFDTWIGKRVRIAGHFLTDIEPNKDEHKQFIFAKYMHEIQESNNLCMPAERVNEIQEQLKDKTNLIRFFKSFAPDIEGRLKQKEAILYCLVGGSPKEVRRVDSSFLEIGNAGKGKSQTIKQVTRVVAKSMYFFGNVATSAGLGIGMVKLGDQTQVPQGGPLVLCSPHGVVGIDEIDKMHPEDQNSLLSSMEQQIVTKVVSGHILSLPSQVVILAAANPKYGEWRGDKPIADNINFSGYLLTRFDIVRCDVKTNSMEKLKVAVKLLGLNSITPEQALTPLLTEEELMHYLNYCRIQEPTISHEAKLALQNFYMQMSELTDGENVVPMTPRELEGMIRLITARAKLLGKNEADMDDFEAIKELKKDALASFPGVKFTGEGQQLKLTTGKEESGKIQDDIINSCMDSDGTVDSVEVCQKWVDAKVFKDIKKAEFEFGKMVGTRFFLRGSRHKVSRTYY